LLLTLVVAPLVSQLNRNRLAKETGPHAGGRNSADKILLAVHAERLRIRNKV
jgi:hypothetical protein